MKSDACVEELSKKIEELNKKTDFIIDIINLLEISGILPSVIIERSRNRIEIEEIRTKLKEKKDNVLKKELKNKLEKELRLQKLCER